MKRLFIAVKINPDKNLLEVYNSLKRECFASKIKWVDSKLFHITLKFLGETPEEKIPVIKKVMEKTVNDFNVFDFDIKGVGIFGSSYRPRVIWLGLERREELKRLGKTIIKSLEEYGFETDSQNFVPHLTVGRIKYVQNKNKLRKLIDQYKEAFLQNVKVEKIILYESILKREGPQYFPLYEVYIKK